MTGSCAVSGDLVSVVMPVWRPRVDWLRAAVGSVLAQEGCEVELVVVDDGCPEPVERLLADVTDDRLVLVRVDHGGVSRARNAGLERASGGWVRFADSDDVLEPGSTARLLELACSVPGAIAYGATELCDEELRPQAKMVSSLCGSVTVECLLNRFEVTLPALLFPRAVVDLTGVWDPSITVSQDWDYVLRALEHAPVVGDERTAVYYRRHGDSASAGVFGSSDSLRRGEEGMRRVIDAYFQRHPEQRGTALERTARARVDLVLAASHREAYLAYLGRAAHGDPAGVRRELRVFARLVAERAWSRLVRGRLRRAWRRDPSEVGPRP